MEDKLYLYLRLVVSNRMLNPWLNANVSHIFNQGILWCKNATSSRGTRTGSYFMRKASDASSLVVTPFTFRRITNFQTVLKATVARFHP